MSAGFANDVEAHRRWEPRLAGSPPAVDAAEVILALQNRIAHRLVPLGFEQHGDEWRLGGEIAQTLRVEYVLRSEDVRCVLVAALAAEPLPLERRLPRPTADDNAYVFRVGDDERSFGRAVVRDLARDVEPLFRRFTTAAEIQRGFDDGTFLVHLRVEDRILIL